MAEEEAVNALLAQERADMRGVSDKMAVAVRGDVRHAGRRASVNDLSPRPKRDPRRVGLANHGILQCSARMSY